MTDFDGLPVLISIPVAARLLASAARVRPPVRRRMLVSRPRRALSDVLLAADTALAAAKNAGRNRTEFAPIRKG